MTNSTKRTNQSSIRYSDRTAEIINAFPGNSFNDKLEKLILHCYDELPRVNQELDRVRQMTKDELDSYNQLARSMREMSGLRNVIETIERYGNKASKMIEDMIKECNT